MLSLLVSLFNYVLDCSVGEAYCSVNDISQFIAEVDDVALAGSRILDLPLSIGKVLYKSYTEDVDSYQH